MDDTGTTLPTSQLTSEYSHMEDIGTQLINVECMQQTIRKQVRDAENNGSNETTVLELKSLLPKLAGLQISLRKSFDTYARPGVRMLRILNLPEELLMKIFEDVRSGFSSKRDKLPITGVKDIKSLRLTCRRFCDTSSHLLIRQLDVSITRKSLNHLDEVSRHPTISKGVRSLRIFAGLLRPLPATDLREFILRVARILGEDYMNGLQNINDYLADYVAMDGLLDPDHLSCGDYDHLSQSMKDLLARHEIMRSCTSYLHDKTIPGCEDRSLSTLWQVYTEYERLCHDQQMLLLRGFVTGVAQAVARLPPGASMTITDCSGSELRTLSDDIFSEIYGNVRDKLLEPSRWTSEMTSFLPSGRQPARLLYALPTVIAQAGNPLTELRICLDPWTEPKLEMSGEQAEALVRAAEHLKVLEIECDLTVQAPEEQGDFFNFVSLLSKGTNLRSVSFAIGNLPEDGDLSAGPLLVLLPWAKLRKITLANVLIHCDEFSELLKKLAPGTYVRLIRVCLLSGLWADLLDVLRAKANCESELIDVLGREDEELGAEDFGMKVEYKSSAVLNSVTKYIRGEDMENPLRSHPAHDTAGQDGMDHDDVAATT